MSNKKGSCYANNKSGVIKAPNATTKGEPSAKVIKGNDLRSGK